MEALKVLLLCHTPKIFNPFSEHWKFAFSKTFIITFETAFLYLTK